MAAHYMAFLPTAEAGKWLLRKPNILWLRVPITFECPSRKDNRRQPAPAIHWAFFGEKPSSERSSFTTQFRNANYGMPN